MANDTGSGPNAEDKRAAWRRQREQRPVTQEEVLRRNYVERIKHERLPYSLEPELPVFAQTSYEQISEEDIKRLQWFGLYHDKPKVGNFMLRIKVPGGRLQPAQVRAIGELARRYAQNQAEPTTRQDVQLHCIQLRHLPEIFEQLRRVGLSTKGGCGDVLRNVTACPVAGIDAEELFDVTPVLQEAHRRFSGHPDYQNLPRKLKWTISACPYHCNAPELNDVALVGTVQDGQPGFAIWVGGGQSTTPRIARSLGVFVTPEEALDVPKALMEIWLSDLRYRMSRAKARFKFLVDDYGVERLRELVEERLGRRLTDLKQNPVSAGRADHMGVHAQRQPGLSYVGFPVFPARLTGDQLVRVADIVEAVGGDVRLTRDQNLLVGNVPNERVDELVERMRDEAQLRFDVNRLRAHSIACTGDPHCNFAVGPTKPKLVEIVEHLESVFGEAVADLRIHLDGCPHACAQHWVADIGLQSTTKTTPEGKVAAYDVLLRGGLGANVGIAKAVLRRVPADEVKFHLERLLRAYLQDRQDGEPLQTFLSRFSDEQLAALLTGSVNGDGG